MPALVTVSVTVTGLPADTAAGATADTAADSDTNGAATVTVPAVAAVCAYPSGSVARASKL